MRRKYNQNIFFFGWILGIRFGINGIWIQSIWLFLSAISQKAYLRIVASCFLYWLDWVVVVLPKLGWSALGELRRDLSILDEVKNQLDPKTGKLFMWESSERRNTISFWIKLASLVLVYGWKRQIRKCEGLFLLTSVTLCVWTDKDVFCRPQMQRQKVKKSQSNRSKSPVKNGFLMGPNIFLRLSQNELKTGPKWL